MGTFDLLGEVGGSHPEEVPCEPRSKRRKSFPRGQSGEARVLRGKGAAGESPGDGGQCARGRNRGTAGSEGQVRPGQPPWWGQSSSRWPAAFKCAQQVPWARQGAVQEMSPSPGDCPQPLSLG